MHVYVYIYINLIDDALKYFVYMDMWVGCLVTLLSLLVIKLYSLFTH